MNEPAGRVLGLDYGDRTVGVAVSDPTRFVAQGIEIIRRKDEAHLRPTLRRIEELAKQYQVTEIVLGLPLNMDDSFGPRTEKTSAFKTKLEQWMKLPVHLQDERLSSVEAEEAMALAGIGRQDYKLYVDQIAASIILQDWLNEHGNN